MEMDLLGELLLQTIRFLDSGFNMDLILHDETLLADIPAKEMFTETDGRWFMRGESIPGDLALKAIAVDADGLYLETGPIDTERVREVIIEEMQPFLLDASARSLQDVHTGRTLISISETAQPEKELGARCLVTVNLKEASDVRRQIIIRLLDLLYTRGCFTSGEDEEAATALPTSQQMVQRLQLGLQQKLVAEQRPLLSLKIKMRDEMRDELRTELQAILGLQFRILAMGPEELLDFLVEYITKHGEESARNILLFTLAGKIKHVMPKLTWKEARRLARKLPAKVPVGQTA